MFLLSFSPPGRWSGCGHWQIPAAGSCGPGIDGPEAGSLLSSLPSCLTQPGPRRALLQHGQTEEYVWACTSPGATPTTERALSQRHEHATPTGHGSSWNSIQSTPTTAPAEVTGSATGNMSHISCMWPSYTQRRPFFLHVYPVLTALSAVHADVFLF